MFYLSNYYLCSHEYTSYDTIIVVQLCHVRNISNDNMCGTEQTL